MLFALVLSVFIILPINAIDLQTTYQAKSMGKVLRLKSIYHHASATGPTPNLFKRYDNTPGMTAYTDETYYVQSRTDKMSKPATHYVDHLIKSRRFDLTSSPFRRPRHPIQMESVYGELPDVTDRSTLLTLAMMTNNAYLDVGKNNSEWYDLGPPWELDGSFGWESDGIRGHVFADDEHSLIIISIKGTSTVLWTGEPTGEKDKMNDNILFSCCCARISRAWKPVCKCYQANDYQCDSKCLQDEIERKELYYDNALEIYEDVFKNYQNSTIWITGHSLGGAIASLVGQTLGVPTVTFEIPGDRMASHRLHLPHAPGAELPLWHFGHTADPIFIGACTGPSSACWYGGYAMESRCHTGKVCKWDTVNDKGWRVDVRTHRVQTVIETILKKPEDFGIPECKQEVDCEDCGLWEYFDPRDNATSSVPTEPTSTSTDNTSSATTTSDQPTEHSTPSNSKTPSDLHPPTGQCIA